LKFSNNLEVALNGIKANKLRSLLPCWYLISRPLRTHYDHGGSERNKLFRKDFQFGPTCSCSTPGASTAPCGAARSASTPSPEDASGQRRTAHGVNSVPVLSNSGNGQYATRPGPPCDGTTPDCRISSSGPQLRLVFNVEDVANTCMRR
jgi:hypothetical protein